MEKKKYYVSISEKRITEMSIPDSAEFEILANREDIRKIEAILHDFDAIVGEEALNILTPLSEHHDTDGEYNTDLKNLYNLLYELGTEKTKREIENMNK